MKMPRLTVRIDGLERIEKVAEMVEKIQVLEALGPNDQLILSTDRRVTRESAKELRSTAVAAGLVSDERHVLILTDGVEIEAVFRAPQQIEIGTLFNGGAPAIEITGDGSGVRLPPLTNAEAEALRADWVRRHANDRA